MHFFLRLVFLIYGLQALTKFRFTGEFKCKHKFLRSHVVVYEDDEVFDNVISKHHYVFHTNAPHMYLVEAEDTNDGLPKFLDSYFELYMTIVHDCTDNGKYKLLTVDLGSYYIKDGQYDETRNIDLNNAGEWTNEVIGTKAMVMSKIFIFNV